MVAPIRFLSGRQQQQKIGVEGSTQDQKVLEVVGRAGIGTTIFDVNVELEVRGDAIISGILTVGNFNVTGVSTFASDLDINASIDVDGHTELDDLNVSGVSTFASDLDINASIDVDGHTELDDLNVSGVSTFASNVDINASIDVDGHTELDDLNVSGVSTFASDLDINASIDVDGHTELDDLNVSGVSTFASDLDINASIDVDGHTELDNLNVSGVSTFADVVSIGATVGIGTIIDIVPYDTLNNGTLSFEASAGQLFSISNNLTSGSIFSVNDVSGIPIIDVDADGTIQLAPYGTTEYVGIGLTNPTAKLDVDGDVNVSGVVTASTGTLISGIGVSYNGVSIGTTITTLDFTGTGISTATSSVGIATINITADISPIMMGMIF